MKTEDSREGDSGKNIWKIAAGLAAVGILVGVVTFFLYFKVENIEVMGSSHYTDEEVQSMVLRGPLASNSVLAPLVYSQKNISNVPFVDAFSVTQVNRNTISIGVKEKKPVGCIPYLDSYIYFDRNGIFIEGSKTRDETVPYFDGIQINRLVMNEKLPIKGTTVLNTAVALATIFKKNEMIPDHIQFDESYQISLLYGDIEVKLGRDENLEEKMNRVMAILPKLSGKKGILHMESVSNSSNTFEQEKTEITAENWNGGYDENGVYTGDGEYDENGNHVGPKPMTELDYALAAWAGGYDAEGDYTGSGEYDAQGNYVGAMPTQELLDANGDWKGGYLEDGSFVGYGEFDREGNYVGPKPEDGSSGDAGANSGVGDEESGEYSTDESNLYSEDESAEYSEDEGQEYGDNAYDDYENSYEEPSYDENQ